MSGRSGKLRPPENLSQEHDLTGFDCGEVSLNLWLTRRALHNEASGASRTYVVCTDQKVIAYYTLAVGAVAASEVPGRICRNMPDPIPVMVLGRLAVDKAYQRQGIGGGLLRDAVLRTVQAADIAGIRAILVHAISEEARRFYERHGFIPSPVDPLTVMIAISEARKMLGLQN